MVLRIINSLFATKRNKEQKRKQTQKDKEQKHKEEFDKCIKDFRGIFERLALQLKDDTLIDDHCCKYAQEIRAFRKPLCQKYATFF